MPWTFEGSKPSQISPLCSVLSSLSVTPQHGPCISTFRSLLWTNESVKYKQRLCFVMQTYKKEDLEINTNRYSLQIFILTAHSAFLF